MADTETLMRVPGFGNGGSEAVTMTAAVVLDL